jgi:hypothetical protein
MGNNRKLNNPNALALPKRKKPDKNLGPLGSMFHCLIGWA